VIQAYSMAAAASVIAVSLLLTPWVLSRSFAFKAYNTTYRGLRFSFVGSTEYSYAVCIKAFLATTRDLDLFWQHRSELGDIPVQVRAQLETVGLPVAHSRPVET
jgi:hypothetical protein